MLEEESARTIAFKALRTIGQLKNNASLQRLFDQSFLYVEVESFSHGKANDIDIRFNTALLQQLLCSISAHCEKIVGVGDGGLR